MRSESKSPNQRKVEFERACVALRTPEAVEQIVGANAHVLGDRLGDVFFGLRHSFRQRQATSEVPRDGRRVDATCAMGLNATNEGAAQKQFGLAVEKDVDGRAGAAQVTPFDLRGAAKFAGQRLGRASQVFLGTD